MRTMTKAQAQTITGGVTNTSKMPCKSYSLPTVACRTGFRMSKTAGSICSKCYANKGFYKRNKCTVEPVQHARLTAIELALADAQYREWWLGAMQMLIGLDSEFRFHDSGDLQSVDHLHLYADLAERMPNCRFWLPTREYGTVATFCRSRAVPENLVIRLSAMFVDQPVKIPASLQGVAGVTASNVHKGSEPIGHVCPAYTRQGKCGDCRACWDRELIVSYPLH